MPAQHVKPWTEADPEPNSDYTSLKQLLETTFYSLNGLISDPENMIQEVGSRDPQVPGTSRPPTEEELLRSSYGRKCRRNPAFSGNFPNRSAQQPAMRPPKLRGR